MNTEYSVSRTENAWVVSIAEYDTNVAPRVTCISGHKTRGAAIDAARSMAGDSVYYVNDAPAATITDTDRKLFWNC